MEASALVQNIADALKYLHSRGIVHRDLKPENLVYTQQGLAGQIKLTDFGLSKIKTHDGELLTACGSPGYVAPEMLRKEPYGEAVDMWSLGVVLYTLLCGFPPFYHQNTKLLFAQIREGRYTFPDPYWTNISFGAKDLVRSLLCLDVNQRLTAVQVLEHPWVSGKELTMRAPVAPFDRCHSIRIQTLHRERKEAVCPLLSLSPEKREAAQEADLALSPKRVKLQPPPPPCEPLGLPTPSSAPPPTVPGARGPPPVSALLMQLQRDGQPPSTTTILLPPKIPRTPLKDYNKESHVTSSARIPSTHYTLSPPRLSKAPVSIANCPISRSLLPVQFHLTTNAAPLSNSHGPPIRPCIKGPIPPPRRVTDVTHKMSDDSTPSHTVPTAALFDHNSSSYQYSNASAAPSGSRKPPPRPSPASCPPSGPMFGSYIPHKLLVVIPGQYMGPQDAGSSDDRTPSNNENANPDDNTTPPKFEFTSMTRLKANQRMSFGE